MTKYAVFILFACVSGSLLAQSTKEAKTIVSEPDMQHLSLNIRVNYGNLTFKANEEIGKSQFRMCGKNVNVMQDVKAKAGNVYEKHFTFTTDKDMMATKDVLAMTAQGVVPTAGVDNSVHFLLDNNIETKLSLEVLKGNGRIDLSGLKLSQAHISGGNSDLMIDFSQQNKMTMKNMTLHTGMGKIVLRNPEYAHAEVITIKNELGDIRIVLGSSHKPGTNMVVQSTIGTCVFVIDDAQPTKIILKTTPLVTNTLPASFIKINETTYTNRAFNTNKTVKPFVITCDKDAGTIEVIEN